MAYLLDRLEVNTGQYTHYLDIYWQSNSSATNQSYLRIIQWIRRTTSPTYGAFGGSPGFSWSNTVNGDTASGTSGAFDFTSVQDITVNDRYLYVTHATDGTKSIGIALSKDYWTDGFPAASDSKTVVLPTIPLSTQPTLSASSVEVGQAVTIDLSSRASSGFDHKIEYAIGSLTAQTAGLSAHEDVETSATFTPPISVLTQMVGLSSASVTVRVTTWSGASQVGTAKTVVLTVTPPDASPYTLPVAGATVFRSLSDGTPDTEGTCLTVSLNASVSSIDTGTEQNDLTYLIEARPYGSGSYFSLDTDTAGALVLADDLTFLEYDTSEPFAVDSAYDVRITITDELGAVATVLRALTPVTAFLDVFKPTRSRLARSTIRRSAVPCRSRVSVPPRSVRACGGVGVDRRERHLGGHGRDRSAGIHCHQGGDLVSGPCASARISGAPHCGSRARGDGAPVWLRSRGTPRRRDRRGSARSESDDGRRVAGGPAVVIIPDHCGAPVRFDRRAHHHAHRHLEASCRSSRNTFTRSSPRTESVTVVVDTAVSLRVASSAPITIPLDRLEDVHELLRAGDRGHGRRRPPARRGARACRRRRAGA